MAKRTSSAKKDSKAKSVKKSSNRKVAKKSSPRDTLKGVRPSLWSRVKDFFRKLKLKIVSPERIRPHKSFKRSYREDYKRKLEVPGITYHAAKTFSVIFKNWKLFLPLLIIAVVMAIVFIGLMNESTFQQFQQVLNQTTEEMGFGDIGYVAKAGLLLISTVTTGGLSSSSKETDTIFFVLIFLILWLSTIFILRHRLAGHKIKLRDALYNAMTPMISSFVIFAIAVLQCIPIFFLIIVYSAAVQTEFLATPFYALLFFIFAALMVILSGYLLTSSLMAFVAVSAPGLYPMKAMHAASDLMMGRRFKFFLRIIALLFILTLTWVAVMLPLIVFDLLMKNFEWAAGIPFVPVCLLVMTCFTGIYITAYLYLYYRWMLNYDEK
ncbi:hypothetical protein IJI89_00145 [Candidatus Saccharibacteria bacterium]|nr:hypothetical protein [Candidatus Saccharibacteria bacterium]